MTGRPPEWLARQAATLTRLHGDRDRTRTAAELHLSKDQLGRYLRGEATLRADQIAPFARVYGVPPLDLVRDLGILDDAPPFDARREMERAGLPAHLIDAHERTVRDWPPDVQEATIRAHIRAHKRANPEAGERSRNGALAG